MPIATSSDERQRFAAANGTGVWGVSDHVGVYGQTDSNAVGVHGYANFTSIATDGVWGETQHFEGIGVYGRNNSTSGSGYAVGVQGTTENPGGRAVYGAATSTTGINYGVRGWTGSRRSTQRPLDATRRPSTSATTARKDPSTRACSR